MKEKHLIRMNVEYLRPGTLLTEDLYNRNGKVLLIAKGETVTQDRIDKLRQFGDNEIMVYNDTYLEAIRNEDIPAEQRQKMLEQYVGFTQLEETVGSLFHNTNQDAWLHEENISPIVQQITKQIDSLDPVMIFSCINFPRPMDVDLQRHSLNVAFMNGMIGGWLNASAKVCRSLVMAGILHDVGKTMIPEEILNAPRKLTPEEFLVIKNHPVFSDELLKGKFDDEIRLAARQHHEKLDGTGYPDGIAGDEILLFSRITAISDIYDAMVSKRSYKQSQLPFHVFDMFYNGEFGGLDASLLGLFLKNMRSRYTNKEVKMSDGSKGVIEYLPPNDAEHPVIRQGGAIAQANEEWYCTEVYI